VGFRPCALPNPNAEACAAMLQTLPGSMAAGMKAKQTLSSEIRKRRTEDEIAAY
jgi:hypothetical protein